MSEENRKRVVLSYAQVEGLMRLCRPQARPIRQNMAGKHLSDDEFVDYTAGTLDEAVCLKLEAHLSLCVACRNEIERLKETTAKWSDETYLSKMRERIQATLRQLEAGSAGSGAMLFRVSLRPLIRSAVASASGIHTDSSFMNFPVMDRGRLVEHLVGTLQRRDDEFYAHVAPSGPKPIAHLEGCKIVLTVSEPGRETPLLKRKMDIGVTTLLGMDMQLSMQSYLEAELFHERA